jgi:hypothetical protein
MENIEITVKVDYTLNELLDYLTTNKFRFHQSFRCIDIFMIKKEDLNNINSYEDMNKCLILRELLLKEKIIRKVLQKDKIYDREGRIINNIQKEIEVHNIPNEKKKLEQEGYVELMRMDDYCYTFSKKNHEFIIEYVAPIGTFIEFEDRNFYSNLRNGESIEELIELFDTFNIKYDKSDYFIKKSWLLYNKIKSNQ